MIRIMTYIVTFAMVVLAVQSIQAQQSIDDNQHNLYEQPPRWLVDVPTAGTLTRAYYTIGFRFYPNGGTQANCDIGLSNRLTLGIAFGGQDIISNRDPNWNPRIEFNIKFRVIDELEYFPAVAVGYISQGFGAWSDDFKRYTFKSRGFYAVASRSFYFYDWTSGWHAGLNYSLENEVDNEKDVNFFLGIDATFKYNLALLAEIDAGLNDDKSALPDGTSNSYGGKGRGYLNLGIKWLFHSNLELEALLKDLLVNRRESETFTREIRLTYIDNF